MRRTAQLASPISTHSAHSTRRFDARRIIRDLEQRVARLEKALDNGIGPLDYLAQEMPAAQPKKPGPRPIHFQGLLGDRDTMIQMLEAYWPEIETLCWPKPKPKSLLRVLEKISAQKLTSYAQAAGHLTRHFEPFLKFLASDRFRRDPRQIANALAGVPHVGYERRSENRPHCAAIAA